MNYTENYHLPQWVKSDRIMMEDFNQMCLDIEAGLTENVSGAAADNAAAVAAAQKAQATADKAVADAAKAQARADAAYAPDQPPYALGTYTGTGNSQSIVLGFRPRFVIVSGAQGGHAYYYTRAAGEGSAVGNLSFNSNGFSVGRNGNESGSQVEAPPYLIESGKVYAYIAFR